MSGQNKKNILISIDSLTKIDAGAFDDVKFQTLDVNAASLAYLLGTIKKTLGEFKEIVESEKIRIFDGKTEYNDLSTKISDLNDGFSTLINFDVKTFVARNQNPVQYVSAVESDIFYNWQELVKNIDSWVRFHSSDDIDFSQYETKTREILLDISKMRDDARDNLSELGVSVHAINYGEAARSWKKSANVWLIVNVVLQVISLGFVIVILYWLSEHTDNTLNYADRLPYFAILALLYSAVFWCSRNYKSSMHQYSINKSKEIMLSTFKTFVDASSGDQDLKNAVLLEVTKSIFSHIDSGFGNSKETNLDLSSKILEIGKKT